MSTAEVRLSRYLVDYPLAGQEWRMHLGCSSLLLGWRGDVTAVTAAPSSVPLWVGPPGYRPADDIPRCAFAACLVIHISPDDLLDGVNSRRVSSPRWWAH